jgi:WD40 repeat protein
VDPLQAGDPGQIGSFRLLGRLGEGGMGQVFLAASPGGRQVAIKVVHPHHANDQEFRRRFSREVAAARQVGGFHTAAVVDADPDANPPWMATAYIPGPSLTGAITQRGTLDEAGVRQLGAGLAEGLAAIHACGLIHRDLKPGNIILADDGPRIIDFGVAKGTDFTAITGSQVVIGTPAYMSPEQVTGQELTPRSDVFALGTVLVYAATGHSPFEAPTIMAVIHRILNDPPGLDPLTGDLRDIIGACLAKHPGSRPSAGDLIARLNPLVSPLNGSRTPAAPAVPAVPAMPLPQPPPPVAAMGSGLAAAAQQAAPWSASTATPPPGPRQAAPRAARSPAAGRRGYRNPAMLITAIAAAIGLVVLSVLLLERPLERLFASIAPGPGPSGSASPGGTTGHHSRSASTTSATGSLIATLTHPGGSNLRVAFAPDGTTLAVGSGNSNIYLWNITTKTVTATLADPDKNPNTQAISGVNFTRGGVLAAVDGNGKAYLWNITTKTIIATLTDPVDLHINHDPDSQGITSVAFTPDGSTFATGDVNGNTYLWNAGANKITATLPDPTSSGQPNEWVAFTPDGTTLVSVNLDSDAFLWNTTTRKPTPPLSSPSGLSFSEAALSPDGTTLAVGDNNGNIYIWNIATKTIIATLTIPDGRNVNSLAWAPDGNTLAVGGDYGTYLWNTATKTRTATLAAVPPDPNGSNDNAIFSVAFTPDGTTLATGAANGKTYLWRITYH